MRQSGAARGETLGRLRKQISSEVLATGSHMGKPQGGQETESRSKGRAKARASVGVSTL